MVFWGVFGCYMVFLFVCLFDDVSCLGVFVGMGGFGLGFKNSIIIHIFKILLLFKFFILS